MSPSQNTGCTRPAEQILPQLTTGAESLQSCFRLPEQISKTAPIFNSTVTKPVLKPRRLAIPENPPENPGPADLSPASSVISERLQSGTQDIWMVEPIVPIWNGPRIIQGLTRGAQASQDVPGKKTIAAANPPHAAMNLLSA